MLNSWQLVRFLSVTKSRRQNPFVNRWFCIWFSFLPLPFFLSAFKSFWKIQEGFFFQLLKITVFKYWAVFRLPKMSIKQDHVNILSPLSSSLLNFLLLFWKPIGVYWRLFEKFRDILRFWKLTQGFLNVSIAFGDRHVIKAANDRATRAIWTTDSFTRLYGGQKSCQGGGLG